MNNLTHYKLILICFNYPQLVFIYFVWIKLRKTCGNVNLKLPLRSVITESKCAINEYNCGLIKRDSSDVIRKFSCSRDEHCQWLRTLSGHVFQFLWMENNLDNCKYFDEKLAWAGALWLKCHTIMMSHLQWL